MVPLTMHIATAENEIEQRILDDYFFRKAILLGRPRLGHPEGVLGVHIAHILVAIDDIKNPVDRSRLRLAALLHDIGKFAGLAQRTGYRPENMPADQLHALIETSDEFRTSLGIPPIDKFVPEHAWYSYAFAKRFTDDTKLLDLVRYHDTGWKIFEIRDTAELNDDILLRYFSDKDAALFVQFAYVDAADREKTIPLWLQDQLLRLGLLQEKII
jgi:hypothetical protein